MTRWADYVAVLLWNASAWVLWAAAIVEVLRTRRPVSPGGGPPRSCG